MSEILRTIEIEAHRPDCQALKLFEKGDWRNPWHFTGKTMSRAVDGSKRGNQHTFLVVGCNAPLSHPCPAKVLVGVESILDEIDTPLAPPQGSDE
jgi:hypothetical protein